MILVDPVRDTTDMLSWGWVAIMYDVDLGQWAPAAEASESSGLSRAALRRWAERGVISQLVSTRKKQRIYLCSEFDVIRCVTNQAPNLHVLKAHIEDVAYNGFR